MTVTKHLYCGTVLRGADHDSDEALFSNQRLVCQRHTGGSGIWVRDMGYRQRHTGGT